MTEKKDVRIQLVMSASEVEMLDEWRAPRRIWSRSEAIRRLVADGVKKGDALAEPTKKPRGRKTNE